MARVEGADPVGNVLEVLLENYDPLIYHLQDIRVEEDRNGFIRQMEVKRKDGTLDVLTLEGVGIERSHR